MTSDLITELIEVLSDVLGPPGPGIALHEPRFAGREWELVKDCLDTGWVSSAGQYVDRFERMVAAACGARHAVAVVNGSDQIKAGDTFTERNLTTKRPGSGRSPFDLYDLLGKRATRDLAPDDMV